MQIFKLLPFHSNITPPININCEIGRIENQLSIRYEVSGQIDQINFPVKSTSPSRKDDLWKATCFEFFIATPGQPQYWEFNMSPSGDWNAYAMDAYRRVGFREETAITKLPFKFERHGSKTILELSVDLNSLFQALQPLQAGITAIIQTTDSQEIYWALVHPGPQADFHLRESFILEL